MSQLTRIAEPEGVSAGNGYPHVVLGSGRLVVISGQIAVNEHGELVGAGDPEVQARQVFENLRRCLAAAEAGFEHVAKLTYFLTDMAALLAVRAVRDEYLAGIGAPASSLVGVSALIRPELLLEVEALAILP